MTKPAFSFDQPERFPCDTCGTPTDVYELEHNIDCNGHTHCEACADVYLEGDPALQRMVAPTGYRPLLPIEDDWLPF